MHSQYTSAFHFQKKKLKIYLKHFKLIASQHTIGIFVSTFLPIYMHKQISSFVSFCL